MPSSEATLRWTQAAGPVAGYVVWVSRNGDPPQYWAMVDSNEATISGVPGDSIEVIVQAFAPDGATGLTMGTPSDPSDPIRFDGPPLVGDAYPWLDCASCRRFELRDQNGSIFSAGAHPSPGDWQLVGIGRFLSGAFHALLREKVSGALAIGQLFGNSMRMDASILGPGFATSTVSRPADLDRDGVDELLLHDRSTGAVTLWGLEEGAIVELARWNVSAAWRFIGFGDVDGDGQLDVWFDATQGNVAVIRLRDLASVGSTFIAAPLGGSSPVDVADYDGDGRSDVLWRNAAGVLNVSLQRGDPTAPSLQVGAALAWQPGDEYLVPSGSWNLDGAPGAEIVLQDPRNGAVDVALPRDAIPGRRQRLLEGDPLWRFVSVD
ncbi:MAG TPA: VCBS repeat-containing protein [Myxococcota bacterium]|nr:VCBS repeat-containing protein [Myxococcota bacterium]